MIQNFVLVDVVVQLLPLMLETNVAEGEL